MTLNSTIRLAGLMVCEREREKERERERAREREIGVRIRLLGLALGHVSPLPSVHQILKVLIYLQAMQSHIASAPEEAVTILWV